MDNYQQYPEYKGSQIEWVGNIPSNWDVKPVFALFSPLTQKNFDGKITTVLSLSYGNIIERDVEKNFGLLPESFNTYQIVEPGDIILRLTDLQNDKRSLRVGIAKQKGIITSAYLKLAANTLIEPRYAYRLLHSYDTTKVFYGMGGGLRQSMKFEDFRRLPILLPPLDEQLQIANFLDHETAKIDTLIEKQQQLIKLLKEKRQAVISHAVTKGLNPETPMKESGVEWLGKVPEHWKVTPLAGVADVVDPNPSHRNPKYTVDGFPFISTVEFTEIDNVETNTPRRVAEETVLEQEKRCNFQEGSIAFSRKGTIGAVRVLPHGIRFALLDSVCVINCGETVLYEFLYQQCRSSLFESQLGAETRGAALKQVSVGRVRTVKTFIPPLEEQKEILAYLTKVLSKLDKTVELANKQVNYLTERRTAIISAAVTGKIDVRNSQKPEVSKEEVA
ncbi:restriction endonuclease subunit S [Alteromonas sp. PRIM-21]|uniref:restriction endonuclease subunit S n=1 Tax=Alteromonas sp. PRIM-21 TaxID=1454978 RepID=UPI0022B9B9A4|nr:restriction endonuclease subunit S [Alteromonas sp. PRIM-21]MCZ8530022.1 restriction endonuclease subunit S [Alteromonas sp. PRIM-21]